MKLRAQIFPLLNCLVSVALLFTANIARADTATTTTIAATPYSTLGSPVTLTATVTPPGVFGGVVFYVDNQYCNAAGLVGGVASVTVVVSTAGNHGASAHYIGFPGYYSPSSSIILGFEVFNPLPPSPVTTTTSLSISSSPGCAGVPFNVVASISPATAVGSVQFQQDGQNVGSPVEVANGAASKTFTFSVAGGSTFQAFFSGRDKYLNSTSPQVSQTVSGFATQPVDVVTCPGTTASFSVSFSNPTGGETYQWQVSTDGGKTFQNVTGGSDPTQPTYTTDILTAADNNNRYRCLQGGYSSCYGPNGVSEAATLTTVGPLASFISETTTPQLTSLIVSGAAIAVANGQYVQSSPTLYNNQAASTAMELLSGNWIIHRVPNNGPSDLLYKAQSTAAIIGAWVPLQANDTSSPVVTQPVVTVCPGDDVSLTVVADNKATGYQWEESFNDGANWITGVFNDPGTSPTFTTDGLFAGWDQMQIHCIIFNDTCDPTTNTPVIVSVAQTRVIAWTGNKMVTAGSTVGFSVAAIGTNLTYQWRVNGNNISDNGHYSGTQTPLLTINNVGGADEGVTYDCDVNGLCGPDSVSGGATLTLGTPADGQSKWSMNTHPQAFSDPGLYGLDGSAAVGSDGTIYFIGGPDRVLHAINTDGTEKWFAVLRTGGFLDTSTPAIGADGTIYVGMADRLAAFDPSTGKEKWHQQIHPLTGEDPSSPAIYTDPTLGEIVFLSSDPAQNISAFLKDGSPLPQPPGTTGWWPISTAGSTEPEPSCTIGPNGTVFSPFENGSVVAFRQDSTILWGKGTGFGSFSGYFNVDESLTPQLTPDQNGAVYIGSGNTPDGMAWAYALDASGNEIWPLPLQLPDGRYILSSACIYNGVVYFTTLGTPELVAVAAATGTPLWTFTPNDVGSWSSPAVTSDGTVIFGSSDNNLYAVSPPISGIGTGTMLWNFTAGGAIVSSPVIAPSDNTIYVGCADGNLYAIQNSKPLANSPWPMYRKNPRRTGSY